MHQKLKGRVALVTGSSRGIGAAIATLFAQAGARVALSGRDESAMETIQKEIEKSGGEAIAIAADVTRFSEIEALRSQVAEAYGSIDILVTNAGGSFTPPGPFEELTEDGWHAAVDNNLTSTFLTIKSVLPEMRRRRSGNIITVSSLVGHRSHVGVPIPYAAAKAGIEILTRDLAGQVGSFGVRVNCIAPGTILTERNRQRIPAAQIQSLTLAHPLQRLGIPMDVGQAALFLASDDSSWITGVVLDVAGGLS